MAAVSSGTYRLVITRENGQWLADVPSLEGAHTYARSLPALDQAVREVVVLAADLPDEAMPGLVLEYDYRTGDAGLDRTAREVRQLRRQADELAAIAAVRTGEVAVELLARGLSVRDVAALLGISPQRVLSSLRAQAEHSKTRAEVQRRQSSARGPTPSNLGATGVNLSDMASEWTVERHLLGKPSEVIALYHRFIQMAQDCGPFTYAVSKTAITLKGTRRGFAGAVPGEYALRGYLDLRRPVEDARITRSDAYTKRLYVNHFRVTSPDQLDEQFAGWLREAYQVGAGAHLTADPLSFDGPG
jgi:hypothetical protein